MPKDLNIQLRVSGDLLAAVLIWMELHTGDTFVIDLCVAVMVTGGIFYSLYAAVMNKLFKNNQVWRFENE